MALVDATNGTTILTAKIDGKDYRIVTKRFGNYTSSSVQVFIQFKGNNGWTWRTLPWWAEKKIKEVFDKAR